MRTLVGFGTKSFFFSKWSKKLKVIRNKYNIRLQSTAKVSVLSFFPLQTHLVFLICRWCFASCGAIIVRLTCAGSKGLESSPLWATVVQRDSQEAVVWRPEATGVRGWREDTIFLGRIPTSFRLHLHSRRSKGQRGDVALDHLEFLDCALPRKFPSPSMF